MKREIVAVIPFAQLAVIMVVWAIVFLVRVGSARNRLILIASGFAIIMALFGAELILVRVS